MRVLLINQYFWPDMAATAQLLTDLAEDLAVAGWSVTALAGRGAYAPGREGRLPARERIGAVEVRRVWCTSFGRGTTVGRVADYLTFLAAAKVYVLFGSWAKASRGGGEPPAQIPRCARDDGEEGVLWDDGEGRAVRDGLGQFDGIASSPAAPRNHRGDGGGRRRPVVVCLSTPPLVAVLGWLARLRGAAFVYKVEDLYPDVAVALGALSRRSPLTAALNRLSRFLLRQASAVVALDEAMGRELTARGARRVEVIPNWAVGEPPARREVDPTLGTNAADFRHAHGLGDRFVVLYSGNLGLAHRFDAVAGAARQLAAEGGGDALFLFVGAGPRLAEVRHACEGLANVTFLPYQPREQLAAMYAAADCHLVTLRDEAAGLLVPSKYAAALATGRPVLLVGGAGADLWDEVEAEGVGWRCRHDAGAVAAVVAAAARDREGVLRRGRAARALFERRYARHAATARWVRLLDEAAVGGAR